jgi:hypothetical protein
MASIGLEYTQRSRTTCEFSPDYLGCHCNSGIYAVLVSKKSKGQRFSDRTLTQDVARREKAALALAARTKKLEIRCADLDARMAESAINRAEREWRDGNNGKAEIELDIWLEKEGAPISQLLVHRSEWAMSRAVGELRNAALIVAERYAEAAFALDSKNEKALAFMARTNETSKFPT